MRWAFSYFPGLTLLLAAALGGGACRTDERLHHDEIERLSRQISRHFQEQQLSEIVALYADSASIAMPGGYRIQGRDLIQAYWRRYFQPHALEVSTLAIAPGLPPLREHPDWPEVFRHLPADFDFHPDDDLPLHCQWALWQLRWEGEDGALREEELPVILVWVRLPDEGWRILRMFTA